MRTKYQVINSMKGMQKKSVDFAQFEPHLDGHPLPEITPDAIGKFRLHTSLQSKFGKQYAAHPVAKAILAHFEMSKKVHDKMGGK